MLHNNMCLCNYPAHTGSLLKCCCLSKYNKSLLFWTVAYINSCDTQHWCITPWSEGQNPLQTNLRFEMKTAPTGVLGCSPIMTINNPNTPRVVTDPLSHTLVSSASHKRVRPWTYCTQTFVWTTFTRNSHKTAGQIASSSTWGSVQDQR